MSWTKTSPPPGWRVVRSGETAASQGARVLWQAWISARLPAVFQRSRDTRNRRIRFSVLLPEDLSHAYDVLYTRAPAGMDAMERLGVLLHHFGRAGIRVLNHEPGQLNATWEALQDLEVLRELDAGEP